MNFFDSAGDVVERYEGACPGMSLAGNTYGTARIYNEDFTTLKTTSDYNNPYYFTGRRLDMLDEDVSGNPQLNIMYYRARSYDTVTGRFMQRDPLDIDPARDRQDRYAPFDKLTSTLLGTGRAGRAGSVEEGARRRRGGAA